MRRPAREQAAWFLANVPNDPAALPPVLDVEWNEQSRSCPHHIPREQALATMQVILDAMEQAYGKKPVIYTSVDFHRDVLAGEFMNYPIWVRSVKTYPTYKYGNRRWHFWQHTAQGIGARRARLRRSQRLLRDRVRLADLAAAGRAELVW